MDLIDFSGLPYPGMSPDLRVLTILAKYAVFGMVPEVIPVPAPDISVPVEQIPVQQRHRPQLRQRWPSEAGYVFYIEPGPAAGMSQAYWGPQMRVGIPQPALNVNMDAWTNVESLSFRYQPQSSVLPIVFIQDQITGVPIPIPIPPVTPFNPPLGLAVPVPQQIRPARRHGQALSGRGADAGHGRGGQERRRGDRRRHARRRCATGRCCGRAASSACAAPGWRSTECTTSTASPTASSPASTSRASSSSATR